MTVDVPHEPLLAVRGISVSFRDTRVLQNVSLELRPRQIVAIVGPNGAGKTTLLKTIAGLVKPARGHVFLEGEPIDSLPVWEIVKRGVVYVPEGMRVFPEMSVLENLEIGAYVNRRSIPQRLDMIFHLLPELREKKDIRAGILSGGQQRMVTLARGLMSGARILLLDDPFQELSPKVSRRFADTFRSLREAGIALFIASQHVRQILSMADMAHLIEDGDITLSGLGKEILRNSHLRRILFGAGGVSPSIFHVPEG